MCKILRLLCVGKSAVAKTVDGADDLIRMDWLVRLLRVFIGSLSKYLEGGGQDDRKRFAEDDEYARQVYRDIVDGKRSGPWWKIADEVFAVIDKAGAQGKESIYILVAVKWHIVGDLDAALLTQGVGTDADWKALGDTVREAMEEAQRGTGAAQAAAARLGVLDIFALRLEVRQRSKETLEKAGVKDSTFSGIPLGGVPK